MSALDQVIVVLHRPQNPLNVGAVVRAMKNMGVAHLRLVEPARFDRDELLRVAHHAEDLVDRVEVHATLDSALADAVYVVGTADQSHPDHTQTYDLRGLTADLVRRAAQGQVALLFGTEADGLDRSALDRCHMIVTLPADPAYPTLNLAQAALLFLYELRLAAQAAPLPPPTPLPMARQADLERLFVLTEEALAAMGFFKGNPAAAMRTLRQIVHRAELTPDEVALLMAVARETLEMARRQ